MNATGVEDDMRGSTMQGNATGQLSGRVKSVKSTKVKGGGTLKGIRLVAREGRGLWQRRRLGNGMRVHKVRTERINLREQRIYKEHGEAGKRRR